MTCASPGLAIKNIGKAAFGTKAALRVAQQLEWLKNALEHGQL